MLIFFMVGESRVERERKKEFLKKKNNYLILKLIYFSFFFNFNLHACKKTRI
jgi:hypothetical protein